MNKQQAIAKARAAANKRFDDIDRFDVRAEYRPPHWTVRFEDPSELSDGSSQHFVVQVDSKTGKSKLFLGR